MRLCVSPDPCPSTLGSRLLGTGGPRRETQLSGQVVLPLRGTEWIARRSFFRNRLHHRSPHRPRGTRAQLIPTYGSCRWLAHLFSHSFFLVFSFGMDGIEAGESPGEAHLKPAANQQHLKIRVLAKFRDSS